MADDTDVLDLDADLEIEEADENEGDGGDEGDEELVIRFADEAAPAPEDESSVIRDLRKSNREMAKKLSAVERANRPQKIDPGPKPELATSGVEGYDEEVYERDLLAWHERVAAARLQDEAEKQRAEAEARTWQETESAYVADRASIKIANFGEAEETVFGALSDPYQKLLKMSGKGAQLVAALSASPAVLDKFSKLPLVEAAMMVGELRTKLKMESRKSSDPERRIAGNASVSASGSDKHLARLEKEAARTGNNRELRKYRQSLRDAA